MDEMRKDAVARIRDAAMAIILSRAATFPSEEGISQVTLPGIRIALRSPKSMMHKEGAGLLPWGLDIWDVHVGGKVFNIQWDESDMVEVVTFKRGKWEQVLLASAVRGK